MSNTRYKVGETTYDIPENKVDSFLQAKPNAVLVNEGKQEAPQTPDATVEQNTTASNSENTSLATDPTEVNTVVELPEVEPVFFKDIEITTDEVRQNVKWGFHELGVIGNLNSKYESLLNKEETIVDSNGKEVRNPEYLEFTRSDLDFGGGKSIYIRSNQLTRLQKESLVKFMPEGFLKGNFFGAVEESGLIKIKLPKANASQEEWDKTTAAINEVIKMHYEGVKSPSVVETNQEKVDRVSTISSTLNYETENIKLREQIEYAVGEEKKRLEEALKYNEENKDKLVDYYKNYDEASETYKYNESKVRDNLSEIERIRKEANRRYDEMVGTEYQLSKFEVGTYQEGGREQYVDSFVDNYKSNLSPNQVDKINKTLTYEKAVEELITETDIYGPTFGMEYEASGEKMDVSFLNDEQKIKLLRGLNGREIAQLAEGDFSVAMKEQQINTSLWSLLNESREQIYEEFEDASSQAKELTQSKKDIDLESQDIQRLSKEINLEFETLNSQIEEIQSILEGDTDKLAKLNSTIEQMKSNPSGYTDAQKQNAINEFNTTLTRINETQGELNTLSDQYKDIEDRNSSLQSRSDALNAKIGQFNSEQENYFKELERLNKRESSLASTYGFTISGEVIGNRFEITDKYQEWKNKNVSGTNSDGTPFNSGFFGSVRDLGNRIGQGLAVEVVDLYVGTGVWATNLLGSFMKGATGIGSYSDSDQVYDRYDQLNAMYKNYVSDASFVAVADNLEGSAFSSYKHSMQTIGNMLPFTLALIGSMRKGNFSNTQAMYKQLSKKGFSKKKLEVLKTTEIGFRLTAIDQYQEAKDLGLNDDQALGYSTFTGLAIGLSNSVFSGEFGFGKQQAVREIFKVFSGNLKKAATKQAINKTIKEATVNLFEEFGEEEVELILSDVAKHSFGLSHAAEFTNFETHQQIVEGTILLSGTLKGVGGGSVQDFKRFKGEIYDGFRQRSGEVIEDINSQIAAIDAKIEQQKNPQYIGPKSADLLGQMKNELIQARDYGMLIQNAINLSPENVTNEQLDLIIQKNELLATKKDTDPAFHAMFDEEINKLNEQIQSSDVTSVARQNFERTVSNTEKIINAINPSLGNRKIQFKSFDGENSTQDMYDFLVGETDLDLETAEETVGSHGGAFVANGVEYIIINKPVSLSSTGANVAAHELLHKMMFMSMAERDSKGNLITDENNQPVINKETSMALAKGLGSYIMGIDATKVENSIFSSRLRAYQEAPASVQAQEVLTLFSDALATGDIKFEESRFEKIGKFLEKAYQAIGLPISTGDSKNPGVKLKTGKDIFNFLKGFNESIKKGSLTADQKAMFLEGATIEGELAGFKSDEDIIEASTAEREEEGSVIMSSKETPLEAINKILPENIKTKEQYDNFINDPRENVKLFNSIMEPGGVINNYIRSRQLTREEGDKMIERVTDRVLGFNPEETRADGSVVGREGFGERVFADTRFSKLDAKKALAIEAERTKQQTSLDDELAKEAVAEENAGQQPERKTKLKVLADQLNVGKQVDGAVANADVDVTSIFSFKSVPNAVAGTLGELMGISPAKIKSKANLTKSELASAQRFIKKNVGVLIGMMPEGFDSSGKATGVPKTMLDAFYTKRESRAKTKAGLQTQVKRSNIKDSEFLEVFNIFEGVPDRSDRNTSARVIALANLMGKVMTNQSIRKQNPSVVSIADGMSKIMFSKDINSKSKESEDVNLNKLEGKQKQKDWLKTTGFSTMPKSFWISNGQLLGSGAKYTNVTVDGKKTKKYELKDGERVAARKMLFANVGQLNNFIKEYEQNGGTFAPESSNVEALVKRTTVYGKKTDKQVRDQINKNQDLYNNSEKGFIDTWLVIQQDIKNNPNNKKHWAALLEVTSTSQANWMRVASRLIGSNTLGLKNVEEHMSPATDFAQYLWGMAKIGKLTPSVMKKAMKSFTQISLPEIYDNLLKGEGFDYTKNLPLEYKFEILSGIMPSWVRYINPQVNAQVHTINGVEYKGMNPNVLILADGKNLAQTYGLGVDSSLEMNQDVISVQQELMFKVFVNNITKAEAVSQLNDYVSNMIPAASSIAMFSKDIDANKTNVNPRGITILDFDDTLATTKSGVRYTMPNPSGKPQPKRKAILIAGNAGAGKTTIINKLDLRKQGFKYVNQDIALDWLTKNNGLPKDMNEFTREQADKWRDIGSTAAVAAKNKAYKLQGKGDGVVIDGTGSVGVQFQGMARDFKDAGYDVQIVFIESSLENAIARNKGRSERRLTDATIRNSVVDAQKNKKAFKEMVTFFPYSAKGFIEINTDNLKQSDPLPANLVETMDNFTKGYIKGRLNAEEFASQGQTLLGEGAEFDFSEFNKVVEGKTAPLFNKAMKLQGKFGPENMFVLTARPAEAQGPIFDFLKANGLNIPLKNITGLGNSTAEAKAMWVAGKFSEGYNDFYFADDALQNVQAVDDVLNQLGVKRKVQQAKIKFSKSLNEDLAKNKNYKKFRNSLKGSVLYHGGTASLSDNKAVWFTASDFDGAELYAERRDGKVYSINSNNLNNAIIIPDVSDLIGLEKVIKNKYKSIAKEVVDEYGRVDIKKVLETDVANDVISDFMDYINNNFELLDGVYGPETLYDNDGKISKGVPVIVLGGNVSTKVSEVKFSKSIQTIPAVANMLDQFDVKSKVQQAKINFSKDLDPKFNKMLERSAGVGAQKIFSRVEAAKRGKNKGRFTFFVPPSAEDFTGLLRYFAGTGKQGDADIQFFNEALVKPFARADRAMGQMKQTIRDDYSALRKKFPEVKKKLGKLIEGTTFTNDMAIRVYLFDKAGYETPGLSKQGKAKLLFTVKTDPEMRAFADALGIISKQKDGYLKPGEYWNTENIALDLQNATSKVGRKQFLQEWVQNKEVIFSPANMNKIEAVYGTQFREALEDVLFRMENGTNRSKGKTYGQNWTNWVNNSVGAIMFFNGRSAVLQTLSTVNFINFEDNNIFAAGKAFANQKQYWSDFSFLFNSDFLRNRRAGLATNVNEAELASAVAGATNKAKAALGYLLKIGFTPTQIADSFAIASGGATYYRNRIKTYIKSGMSQDQAESRAMLDFQEIAEETQQSARPDRISQQQASNLGRIILAFANTPMQYNRLIKKAAGDLVNKRGDWRSNVSRILYYGAIQNFIFASLQNALFALAFDDDDEELTESQQAARDRKEDTKNSRILNSMFDSLARGSGVYGAALATIKNAIFEFYEQEERGFKADYNQVAIELLNVSPPLGSKVRKLASAGYTRKVKKDVMQEMSMLDYDNPAWESIGNVVEAATNIPMARVIRKADNLREAFNQENSAMQRVFLALGWSAWDLDVGTEVVKNEGKKNEYVVTLDTKRMKQYEVEKKIDERKTEERREEANKNKIKKKEKEARKNEQEVKKNIEKQKEEGDDATCAAISVKGNRCKRKLVDGKSFCTVHEKVEKSESGEMKQCKKIKSDGNRCGVKTNSKSGLCYYHD